MALDIQPLDIQPLDIQALDIQPLEDEEASWGTAFKQKLAEAGNAADAAISLPAGALAGMFSQEEGDRIWKEMEQRRAVNLQGANPNNQKLSTAQQVGGTVATLPAQLLGMFGAPAEKGMDLINRGESVGTAQAATLLDTVGNVAGVAPMAPAATFLGRAGIGASSNMAFGAGSDAATQLLAEKQSTKDAYDPYNVERRVVEGLTGGVLQGALGERPAIKSANPKVNKMVMEQMKREAPAAPKLDIEPIVDTKSSLDKTKEAYESAVREHELQRQSAFNRPEQLGNLEAEGPMSRMARDLGAEPGIPERTPSRMEQDLTSRPMTSEQMNAMNALEQRQRQAQESITRRQTELEQAVQRQASLDNNASMRQRQEAASAVSDAHRAVESERARAQSVLEDIRLAEESSKAARRQQMEIDDTQHVLPDTDQVIAPQYGTDRGIGRVDENGMPIRADRSMEAQQLENPLQRNLWGDELPRESGQEAFRGITKAIDMMDNGTQAREDGKFVQGTPQSRAVSLLSGNPPLGTKKAGFNMRSRKQGGGLLIGERAKPEIRKTAEGFEALLNGKVVGYLKSNLTGEQSRQIGENANVDIVKVAPDVKGKGIGSALYEAWSQDHGGNIAPSGKTSKEAWNLWKNKYPEKVDNFVRQEALRIKAGADRQMVLGNITDPTIAQRVFDASQSKVPFNFRKQGGAIAPDVFLGKFPEFAASKMKDALGQLKFFYHGTSKDKAFSDIKAGPRGAWFTDDPKGASEYAKQNDSQKMEFNPSTRRYDEVNTAANVHQVYLNITNPYKLSETELSQYQKATNYSKFQRDITAKAKSAGYDGIDWGGGIVTAFDAKQIKSAISPENSKPQKMPFNFKKQGGGLLISPKEKTGLDNALALSDDGTFIPKNPNVLEVVDKALAEGKDGMENKWLYLQSGATSAAMKTGSAAIKASAEIVQNALKRADLAVRNAIFPAETALKKLNKSEITELSDIFQSEMKLGKRIDADILMQNLTTKQLDAYTHMRDMFDKSLDAQNLARKDKDQPPITPNEAYMASRWSGDFRRPVHDANGKLVWYLAADSKLGLEAQTKALLKEFPTLVIDKAKDHQVRSTIGKTDLQSMYTTMLDILGRNDPAIDKIKAALEDQTTAETEMLRGQEKHFERKGNIRGFVGDRPGTTPGKEAIAMFEQQIQYAKNAFTWSEMQKAADDIKGIVSNPDLQAQQPNNVKYIREYFKNAIGHGEAKVMRALDDTMREGMGVSPKVLSEAVGDIKSFFIMQKLAASAGFALSNVIQSTNVIPYLADLHAQGYKGNAAKALGVGYSTGLMMAVSHYLKASGGEYVNKLPNQFLKDAIQYAEDNGVTARSIYDESPLGASFSKVSQAANIAGKTMTIPETWVRSTAFMTYAQMLKDSGKYSDMSKLFQHAEELVNASMVDYRQTEKPLMFAKGGTLGNFLNTLQTYPMSFYNQYSYMVGQASNGNVLPLVAMVALQGAIAGAMGVPYAEDVYKAFKYVKDELVSTSTWKDMQDSKFLSDPKLWVMETLGNGALYGALSDQSGLGMTSRVSAPSAGAMLQSPLGPITDLYKQGKSVGSALIDPANPTKWAQAGMNVVPTGLSGLLETAPFMKDHTYIVKPNGEKVFMKTSDLAKRDASVSRTPEEVGIRKFGLRSQREVVEKDVKYMTDTANTVAKDRAKDLVEKIYNSARNGDAKKTKELTSLYTRLTGKELTDEQIDRQVKQEYLTGFQKSANKENMTPQEAINFARMRSILENSK